MVDLGPPSKFSGRQNETQNRPSAAKLSKICMVLFAGGEFHSRLVFPKTNIITVPFGPSGFEKVICSIGIGSFFVCSSVLFVIQVFIIIKNSEDVDR